MSNYQIYVSLFSETIHTILKIFSQHGSVGRDYSEKNRVLVFLAKIFGQVVSAPWKQSH